MGNHTSAKSWRVPLSDVHEEISLGAMHADLAELEFRLGETAAAEESIRNGYRVSEAARVSLCRLPCLIHKTREALENRICDINNTLARRRQGDSSRCAG